VIQLEQIHKKYLIELKLSPLSPIKIKEKSFHEFDQISFLFLSPELNLSNIIYSLMDEILRQNKIYCEENFLFDKQARFSRKLCPVKLAKLSITTREKSYLIQNQDFQKRFKINNEQVDSTRLPSNS